MGRRVRKFDGPLARGLWWRLTPQILKKRGAAGAADCVEGLWKKVLKMDRPYGPEGS